MQFLFPPTKLNHSQVTNLKCAQAVLHRLHRAAHSLLVVPQAILVVHIHHQVALSEVRPHHRVVRSAVHHLLAVVASVAATVVAAVSAAAVIAVAATAAVTAVAATAVAAVISADTDNPRSWQMIN